VSDPELQSRLGQRVADAARLALDERGYVTPLDVLVGIRWLHESHPRLWRQERLATIEEIAQVDLVHLTDAVRLLGIWAHEKGLTAIEVEYRSTSKERRPLRFTRQADPDLERSLRTHWAPPGGREEVARQPSRPTPPVAIAPLREWTCRDCGGTGDLLVMDGPGPLCLTCADLDHLVFLPAGDAALTRRATKGSTLSAVVVRFSRSRKRYERQGILVEEAALDAAEAACLADAEVRERRRERAAARRPLEDQQFQARFAAAILEQFPGCPAERAAGIARHAGQRGSGRVGRSRAGRATDPEAVRLAVRASVRHQDTDYDLRLMGGEDRAQARDGVEPMVNTLLREWSEAGGEDLRR
jgi:hypothetical protein